jgi:hypothetical protein
VSDESIAAYVPELVASFDSYDADERRQAVPLLCRATRVSLSAEGQLILIDHLLDVDASTRRECAAALKKQSLVDPAVRARLEALLKQNIPEINHVVRELLDQASSKDRVESPKSGPTPEPVASAHATGKEPADPRTGLVSKKHTVRLEALRALPSAAVSDEDRATLLSRSLCDPSESVRCEARNQVKGMGEGAAMVVSALFASARRSRQVDSRVADALLAVLGRPGEDRSSIREILDLSSRSVRQLGAQQVHDERLGAWVLASLAEYPQVDAELMKRYLSESDPLVLTHLLGIVPRHSRLYRSLSPRVKELTRHSEASVRDAARAAFESLSGPPSQPGDTPARVPVTPHGSDPGVPGGRPATSGQVPEDGS